MRVLVEFDLSSPKDRFLFEHVEKMKNLDGDPEVLPATKGMRDNGEIDINIALTGRADPTDGRTIMEG